MLPDQAQVALQAVPTRAHGNKAPAAAKAYAVQDAREAAIAARTALQWGIADSIGHSQYTQCGFHQDDQMLVTKK